MRVALVSPYSWTYPGGVTRHIEALAASSSPRATTSACSRRSIATGAVPRCCTAAHARSSARRPDWLVPLGRHDRLALQRGRLQPRRHSARRLHAAPRAARGDSDVVHVHEPVAPVVGWDALTSTRRAARRHVPLLFREPAAAQGRRAARRAPQAQPAARARSPCPRPPPGPGGASTAATTGSIPNGVALPEGGVPAPRTRAPGDAAADRVRRPGRRAQGPAGAAARLRGAARARCPPS